MNQRMPFPPRGGWPPEDLRAMKAPAVSEDPLSLWQELGRLGLTAGGKIVLILAVSVVGGLGLIGAIADSVLDGVHGDQEGGILAAYAVVAVVAIGAAVFALDAAFRGIRAVFALDAAFRGIRRGVRRLRR